MPSRDNAKRDSDYGSHDILRCLLRPKPCSKGIQIKPGDDTTRNMPAFIGRGVPSKPPTPTHTSTTPLPEPTSKPVRVWKRRTDRPLPVAGKVAKSVPSSTTSTPLRANFAFIPKPRQVSSRSTQSAKSARSTQSAQSARSHGSRWSGKSGRSARSGRSTKSRLSSHSHKGYRLPPLDLSHPLSKLAEALDLANISAPSAKERRATKAALALRQLILDPPQFELCAVALPTAIAGLAPVGAAPESAAPHKAKGAKVDASGTANALTTVGTKGKKSFVPRLREKDVSRLRTQLLKPTEAKMVIAHARSLPVADALSNNDRAVCLNCPEDEAGILIEEAHRIEGVRRKEEERFDQHRFSTIKAPPQPPPRLPVLLSLFSGLTAVGAMPGTGIDASITMLGLFEPASAMSLHRPLAGALPSADTLRRGFDALINAESKVYMYRGPSHKNIHPPTDRMSVYTYWWGFELALPPATMKYLAHAKSIATSVLNLLSVIVYAVPGGTRELAPFVGVLSRFIDNEWALLKSQDKGKGVVCGATWFIPAALTARPWDFGEETIRDRIIAEEEKELLKKEPVDPAAVVKIKGPQGEEEQGVVVGIGNGLVKGKRNSPVIPWRPVTPKVGHGVGGNGKSGSAGDAGKGEKGKEPYFGVPTPSAPKRKPVELPAESGPDGVGGGPGWKERSGKEGHVAPRPPDIPIMPIFAVQGTLSSSAPASPARTTPPTPARAKFGWKHKAFRPKPVEKQQEEKEKDNNKPKGHKEGQEDGAAKVQEGPNPGKKELRSILKKRTADAAPRTQGPEVIGSAEDYTNQGKRQTDYSELAPLEVLPETTGVNVAQSVSAIPARDVPLAEVAQHSSKIALDAGNLGTPQPEASSDTKADLNGVATPSTPGMLSRTMRRVQGTLGRIRSSVLYPSAADGSKIDPYPLPSGAASEGAFTTPAVYKYDSAAVPSASSTEGTGRKRRSMMPWSAHFSVSQTVRETRGASRLSSLIVA